jgi:hypothetical protein
MTTEKKNDETNRLTRRTLLVSAAAAAAFSQLGCGAERPPSLTMPGAWLANEMSFDGDFAEKDRYGNGYVRCISPVVVGYDARLRVLEIERYAGNAPGSRGIVAVPLERAVRARLSADNGPIMYACSIGNVGADMFIDDLLAACSGIGLLGRPAATFLPANTGDLRVDTVLMRTAGRRIEIDDPRIELDIARREAFISCGTSAGDGCPLDDMTDMSLEIVARQDPKRISLDIDVFGRTGEIGDAALDVLRTLAITVPSRQTNGDRAFVRP